MSIRFTRQNSELILILAPDGIEIQAVIDELDKGEDWHICRCFSVNKKHLRKEDPDENELYFYVGTVQAEYTHIDNEILGIEHDFYFSNDIKLDKRHFVAYRNISVLAKIDEVVDQDVYIGGNHSDGCIPIETFEFLIKKFPKTAELDYYAHARIATIVKEFFPKAEIHEIKYNQFLNRRDRNLTDAFSPTIQTSFQENAAIEFRQFNSIRYDLVELLKREQGVSEKVWQEQIHGLLRLLYPKYIAGVREVVIKGVDRHDKRPDFLLVDANGYIDILEIKKPSVQLLTKQSSYRNNYHLSQSDSEQQPEVADSATEYRVERKTAREPVGLARGVPMHGHRLRHERQAEQIVHQRQAAEYELEYEHFPVGESFHVRTSLSLCALVRPLRKTRASSSTLVFSS